MSGIAGWVAFDRDLRGEQSTIDAMTETLAHRGPDGRGTWIDTHAALGHHRLATIDVQGGAQPMSVDTPDGAVTMVYCGETYNFAELRSELAGRGHQLRTDSDTEVVLQGYLEWGAAVAERLNGMYAFAIWDGRVNQLVMIRDRMGVKPLYYYPTEDGVLFGSEPKAILANPLAERTVTLDGLREVFAFFKRPGHAVWEGMHEVKPGTVATVAASGVREHVYWSLQTREHPDGQEATVEHVRELLHDSVRRQMFADVPRCTLLSGGLDSSAVTAIAAQQLGEVNETLRSFAVDFVGQAENFVPDDLRGTPDTPYVQDVAKLARTEHQDIVLDSDQLADPDVRAKVIRARDIPMGLGDMDSSLYLLFAAIKQHSTIALSGESADEIFGGYKQFFDPEARKGTTFPWMVQFNQHLGEGNRVLTPSLSEALNLEQHIQDGYNNAVGEVQRLDGESDFDWQMRKISYLHLTRFLPLLLDRKDRMSMAVGLTARAPICDYRIVDYVYNAPWSLKTYDGQEKSLLRGASADVLPRSVVERVKSPYPSTQDPNYAVALQRHGKELLANPGHQVFDLIDKTALQQAVETDAPQITQVSRQGLERALDLSLWLDMYAPTIKVS